MASQNYFVSKRKKSDLLFEEQLCQLDLAGGWRAAGPSARPPTRGGLSASLTQHQHIDGSGDVIHVKNKFTLTQHEVALVSSLKFHCTEHRWLSRHNSLFY